MSLIASVAVGDTDDLLGIALAASERCIAIELEDSSLHIFDAQGKSLRAYETEETSNPPGLSIHRLRKTFAITRSKLIVAKKSISKSEADDVAERSQVFIEIVDTMMSTTDTTINILEQPHTICSYSHGDSDHIIISPHGACVQLITAKPPATSSLSENLFGQSTTTIAAANITPFKVWKHYIAHSILALLGVHAGLVQLWRLPSTACRQDNTGMMTSFGTIYATAESLVADGDPSTINPERRYQSNEACNLDQVFCVLIHSSGCIITGHENGSIKVWDCGAMQSGDVDGSRTEGTYHSRNTKYTKPIHVVQNSAAGKLVNGLLEHIYQSRSNGSSSSSIIVATDIDGFVRLWKFKDDPSLNNDLQLTLVGQHKLFDHAVLRHVITRKGWLVAGGKEGNAEDDENDACGLNCQVKMLDVASLLAADGGRTPTPEIRELGPPSIAVWDVKIVDSLLNPGSQNVVVSLMRRGRAWLEIWNV